MIKLGITTATDYFLWKTTRKLKQPIHFQLLLRRNSNTWAKSKNEKAETFAEHLNGVFILNPSEDNTETITKKVSEFLNQTHQLGLPINKFTKNEVRSAIEKLNEHNASGYDLITAKIMRELPVEDITVLT